MFSRFVGSGLFILALCVFATNASVAKPKDTKVPKVPLVTDVGTIKSVDSKPGTFVLIVEKKIDKTKDGEKTELNYVVTADTKFIGPKGGDRGKGKDGFKDVCMEPGYTIKVLHPKEGTFDGQKGITIWTAVEVHLSNRKPVTTLDPLEKK